MKNIWSKRWWKYYEVCEKRERCKNNAAFWQGMFSVVQPAQSHLQPAWLEEQSRTTLLKEPEKNQRAAPAVAHFSASSSNTTGAVCSHSAGLTLKSLTSFCKLQPSWLQSSSILLLFLKLQVADRFLWFPLLWDCLKQKCTEQQGPCSHPRDPEGLKCSRERQQSWSCTDEGV